jgi:hypothetical protein
VKDKITTLTFGSGKSVSMKILQGQMRGELSVAVTEEAHVYLASLHSAFIGVFVESVTRHSIVKLAIRDLWENINEVAGPVPLIEAHLVKVR